MATTKATLDIPAPRPWRLEGQAIRDREGGVVVSALNPASMATRRLIVEAVNAHARRAAGKWRISERMSETIVDSLNRVQASAASAETAALIIEAVNERDRLRDLVRRLAEFIRHSVYDCGGSLEIDITSSRDTTDGTRYSYHGNAIDLIREAEAALAKEAQA